MASSLDLLADTAVLVSEGWLGVLGELPRKFWDKVLEMHGQDVKLVLQKRLCFTDMNRGWLSIPEGQIKENFLTRKEIQALKSKKDFPVSLIEPCLEVHHGLQLKRWKNGQTFSYVLTKQWKSVAHPFERNGLHEKGLVQLWSFRADGKLCFCLVNVEAPPAAVENMVNHE